MAEASYSEGLFDILNVNLFGLQAKFHITENMKLSVFVNIK